MLRIDLSRLAADGSVEIEATVQPGDALWDGLEIEFVGEARVRGAATQLALEQVLFRGSVTGRRRLGCRRCLDAVEEAFEVPVTALYVPDTGEEVEDGETRAYDARSPVIELGPDIREELMLALPGYAVCSEECRGICPRCGANLNESPCSCEAGEPDPRWDALRALKSE